MASKVDNLIAQAAEDRQVVQDARAQYKETQDKLRGLRDTHALVGGVLTEEQLDRINEIAPVRKAREAK